MAVMIRVLSIRWPSPACARVSSRCRPAARDAGDVLAERGLEFRGTKGTSWELRRRQGRTLSNHRVSGGGQAQLTGVRCADTCSPDFAGDLAGPVSASSLWPKWRQVRGNVEAAGWQGELRCRMIRCPCLWPSPLHQQMFGNRPSSASAHLRRPKPTHRERHVGTFDASR